LGQAQSGPHDHAPEPGPPASLTAALSRSSSPLPPGLRQRLMDRVVAHRRANADIQTLRKPMMQSPEEGPGWQRWPLRQGSQILSLQAGAAWTLPEGSHELLLLGGALRVGEALLAPHQHALVGANTPLQALEPARFYWRQHGDSDPFQADPGQVRVAPAAQGWQPLRDGVQICPLHAARGAISLLARFDAGGRVPSHPHQVDEQCLMVEGDLFLGDVLLREGGFQFAPSGSAHGDLFADAPCLLFFHGAIDAAAIDNRLRAQQGWPAL
jgi:ChrR Cupin-like domain